MITNKKNFFFLISLCFFIFYSHSLKARPVSYAGGWTSMLRNNGFDNSWHIHYSPTAKYSLGVRFNHFRPSDQSSLNFQYNYLVKRWNKRHSQANLYILSGVGGFQNKADNKYKASGFIGFLTDWETRRWFFSYKNFFTKDASANIYTQHAARMGVAPYVGGYGSFHTWLMIQLEHRAQESYKNNIITPLLRFFKGAYLVEVGFSNKKDWLFNWIYRY